MNATSLPRRLARLRLGSAALIATVLAIAVSAWHQPQAVARMGVAPSVLADRVDATPRDPSVPSASEVFAQDDLNAAGADAPTF